ncbi:MAG TPA: hypothetical protein VGD78_16835 [Chthoniobacterales bacterium]
MRPFVTSGCGRLGNQFIRDSLAHHALEFITNVTAVTNAAK